MAKFPPIPPPPPGVPPDVAAWMYRVSDAFTLLPAFSHFSTAAGPDSTNQPAEIGTLGIEIGSGTTKLYVMKAAGWTGVA